MDDLQFVPASIPLSVPPAVPLSQALPGVSGAAPGGQPVTGLASILSGSNAEAELVKGLLNHQLVLTSRATAAAAWLYSYGLGDLVQYVLELRKYHQRPSGLARALEAVALKSFMGRLQVQLGNK